MIDQSQESDLAVRSLCGMKCTSLDEVSPRLKSNTSAEPIASLSVPLLRHVTIILQRRGVAESRFEGRVIHKNKIKSLMRIA